TFIAGIRGGIVPGGIAVYVRTNGKLGTNTSSRRFKDEIKPMDNASEAILALQPVTFRYKPGVEPDGIRQFVRVAEDGEKVNPDLVARDDEGKPYTVRYEAVNAMLLNEFIKEHATVQDLKSTLAKQEATVAQQDRKIREQEAAIAQLKSTVAQQQKGIEVFAATLKEQAVQIQKMSAHLALSRSGAPAVVDDRFLSRVA